MGRSRSQKAMVEGRGSPEQALRTATVTEADIAAAGSVDPGYRWLG